MSDAPLLSVDGLSVSFPALRGERLRVLDGVSFDVGHSETVALVGESGSGKTVTALAVIGLLDRRARVDGGRVLLDGRDVLALPEDEKRTVRGRRIGMIFQSPKASLNPLVKAGEQIARVVRLHRGLGGKESCEVAVDLMRSVGINDAPRRYHAYPHQLSGGMAQRVMIAMALSAEPELLIADEPTTGLDVTIQEQIFEVLLELQERLHMSVLLITHDLAVVAETCERVVVMHGGHVVEVGPAEAVFEQPGHPYTRRLLGSLLRADRRVDVAGRRAGPSERILYATPGCRYAAKCEHVFEPCRTIRPELLPVGGVTEHGALCHLFDARFSDEPGAVDERAATG
jgi:oligopeptide/dipeptide ABC transporter ATP-binding protein